MSFVTLQTFTYPHELAVVRSLLESEGIKTFVMNDVIAQVNPAYNTAGGIRLMVNQKDADQALALMVEKGFILTHGTFATPVYRISRRFQKAVFILLLFLLSGFLLMEILQIYNYSDTGMDCLGLNKTTLF